QGAGRTVTLVGAYARPPRLCTGSLDADLPEWAQVEDTAPGANGHVLPRDVSMPARTAPGIVRLRRPCRIGIPQEPMGPLPSRHLAEIGALCCQLLVQRAVAHAPRGGELAKREMFGIEEAQRLGNARHDEGARRLPRECAAHIHVPQVEGRRAADDPFGEGLARTGG